MHKTTLHYSERLLREAVVSFVIRSFIRRLGAIFFSLSPSSLESSFIFSPNTIAVGSLAFSLLPSYLPLYSSPPFSLPITAILLAVSDRCVHRRRRWLTTNRSSPWPRSLAVPRCLGQPSLRCGATHATGSLYSRPRSLLPCRLTASTRTRKISLVVRPQRQWAEANGGAAIIYAAAAAESGNCGSPDTPEGSRRDAFHQRRWMPSLAVGHSRPNVGSLLAWAHRGDVSTQSLYKQGAHDDSGCFAYLSEDAKCSAGSASAYRRNKGCALAGSLK